MRTDINGKRTPEYIAWRSMRQRCRNSTCGDYKDYGGRGITICPEWDDFTVFLKDVGKRPSPVHTLDRKNPNGNYEPENVRWATRLEQGHNKRNTRYLTFEGRTQPMSVWARELGLSYFTLNSRLRAYGWSVERTLSEAIFEKRKVDTTSITTAEAAHKLGVSQTTIYAWIRSKRLPVVKIRGLKRVPLSALGKKRPKR